MLTKYGTAKINNKGYYAITTRKEGNYGRLLHRLIFEDFYGPIPNGCEIHHKDENRINNCIMNLQCLTKTQHNRLHNTGERNSMFGKNHSLETKKKMSKSRTTTNILGVSKCKDKRYKKGFRYYYQYYEDGKRKQITSTDLKKLEEKVREKGLLWEVIGLE